MDSGRTRRLEKASVQGQLISARRGPKGPFSAGFTSIHDQRSSMSSPTQNLTKSNGRGCHLQGYALTTFNDLIEALGRPHLVAEDFFDGKVTAEWCFKYLGVIFTVYDWKENGTPTKAYPWHIGGTSNAALAAFAAATGIKASTKHPGLFVESQYSGSEGNHLYG